MYGSSDCTLHKGATCPPSQGGHQRLCAQVWGFCWAQSTGTHGHTRPCTPGKAGKQNHLRQHTRVATAPGLEHILGIFKILSLPCPPLSEPQFPYRRAQNLARSPIPSRGGQQRRQGCGCGRPPVHLALGQVQPIHSQACCPLGSEKLPRANMDHCAIRGFFFFFSHLTTKTIFLF